MELKVGPQAKKKSLRNTALNHDQPNEKLRVMSLRTVLQNALNALL